MDLRELTLEAVRLLRSTLPARPVVASPRGQRLVHRIRLPDVRNGDGSMKVLIPGALRSYTDQSHVEAEGDTLDVLFANLNRRYPRPSIPRYRLAGPTPAEQTAGHNLTTQPLTASADCHGWPGTLGARSRLQRIDLGRTAAQAALRVARRVGDRAGRDRRQVNPLPTAAAPRSA
jgi:hypothetical protein